MPTHIVGIQNDMSFLEARPQPLVILIPPFSGREKNPIRVGKHSSQYRTHASCRTRLPRDAFTRGSGI